MKRLLSKKSIILVNEFIKNKNKIYKFAKDDNYIEICNGLDSLLNANVPENLLEFEKIIRTENPDCIYDGIVYRKIVLDSDILDDCDEYINKNELINIIHSNIQTNLKQSSSKSLWVCRDFETYIDGIEVIIKYKTNGLDIMKLCKKYENILEKIYEETNDDKLEELISDMKNNIDGFEWEEEVLGEVPSNYEILYINDKNIDNIDNEIFTEDLIVYR